MLRVLIPLSGPVSQFVSQYRDWVVSEGTPEDHVASHEAMMLNGSFIPLFEAILDEIIKEDYLMITIPEEPASNRILREWGMPEEVALRLKMEALNTILALIYGYLPDIYLAQIQSWQYGITEGWMLIMHIPKDHAAT
jgi:hypothetical protein